MHRRLGPKRPPGSREGLTRAQAERELHRRMETERVVVRSRLTIEEAGRRYLDHVLERKPSTVSDYRYMLGRHFVPFFGTTPVERVKPHDIGRYLVVTKR